MKKSLSVLLALCLLAALFCACGKGETASGSQGEGDLSQLPRLTLCVDLGTEVLGPQISQITDALPGSWKEYMVITETVPVDGPERENTLTRLRTEILAGKGPDVFLCNNAVWAFRGTRGLFPFPEKAMKNRIFLPLDSYIEKAQFMDWDKQVPAVMEAGRGEEGQMLLPLGFNLPVTLFPKETGGLTEKLPMPWAESLESGDRRVSYAATWCGLEDILGQVADYGKDAPVFTEEHLLEIAEKWVDQKNRIDRGEYPEFTEYVPDFDNYRSLPEIWTGPVYGFGAEIDLEGQDYYMIPACSEAGGLTAQISAFGGVNRNTQMPQEAFTLLDYIMSENMQRTFLYGYTNGFAPQRGLAQKDKTIGGKTASQWNMDQYNGLLEKIDRADFYTEVNEQLWSILSAVNEERKPLESSVHKAYTTIQMLLAES
ncbi:hypothetical protein D7X94_13345 [Acutalibacter sp. 1XD8-33]|uniref:hypothetical protein n=1 Tax=Acutalibacter sp. 1XD8-33 TaxID=2320081 RepID=UPI000EA3608C|nr:hypothetical protein [Acutalibacter sp. 1XD8-33]RKJ39215.1 hypothetical protein D7X94_13345 [Acutalibacter sp. 1XD8-33]